MVVQQPRPATDLSPAVPSPVAPSPVAAPTAPPGTIPTQRSRDEPSAPAGPSAPGSATPAAGRGSRRTTVLVVSGCVVLLGALVSGIVVKLHLDAEAAAWAAAEARVAAEVEAAQVDDAFFGTQASAASAARYDALVAESVAQADVAVAAAQSALAASPNAGEQALATLQAATDAVSTAEASAGQGTSPAALEASVAAIQAPQQAAVDAQAAWQVAEDARIAAEQAAAEAAAAQAAAARSTTQSSRRSTTTTTGSSTPSTTTSDGQSSSSSAAAATTTTTTTWAAGVESYGVSGLGAALNAARAANGLPALAVQSSTSLTNHAAEMAAAGSIWHSGSDHIVGWVQPVSDAEMIQAYMNSAPHRAWILKEGKTTVSIGAVVYNGRLYTAMLFS
ncbi:MAG TPA: hypothetical protein VGC67_14910 [Cellulomonas sp.]